MKTELLTVIRDTSNSDFYLASYTGTEGVEAQNLAYKGNLSDAISAALNAFGLSESDVYIEASN